MLPDVSRFDVVRAPGLLSQAVGDEYVVVDPETRKAHALKDNVAVAWRALEAGQPVTDTDALAQLLDAGLVVAPGMTRRAMLARTGLVAAGVGIVSIGLPMADAAASLIVGTPSIVLTPNSGPEGTEVQVTGSNFVTVAGRIITSVKINGITVTPSNTTISVTGTVNFTFQVPAGVILGAGNLVQVTDNHNNTGTATFTVTATGAASSPPSLPRNGSPQTVVVGGSGFTPGSTITVTNGSPTDFTTVTGGPFTATAAGEVPTGSTVNVTYGGGSGTGRIRLSDGTHTFQIALAH